MQTENFQTLFFGGQVDKENFIEAALAHKLRRQLFDVIGGGDDENGGFLFLHPGNEAAEYASLRAAVSLHAADASKALIHLIDPEDAGGHGFGNLDHFPGSRFRFADITTHQPADIQPEQRHMPLLADGLGAERLAGALNTDDKNTLGVRQTELLRLFRKGHAAGDNPAFEDIHTADGAHGFFGMEELQYLGFADDLLFFFQNELEVIQRDFAAAGQRVGKDGLDRGDGKALESAYKLLEAFPVHIHHNILGDIGDVLPQLRQGGQLEFQHADRRG